MKIDLSSINISRIEKEIHLKQAYLLIKQTYWGHKIDETTFGIQNNHSMNFGLFMNEHLIGFFR
uniref:hypothetical protein n=1 Tax=Umezakia ovalisporum TaxID=75695 RepID=UPI0039C6F2F6